MTPDEFGQKIKQKYPQYANIDNNTLTQKVIQKYPVYSSQVQNPQQPQGPQPFNGMSDQLIGAMMKFNPQVGSQMLADRVDPYKQAQTGEMQARTNYYNSRSNAPSKPGASVWVNPSDPTDVSPTAKEGYVEYKVSSGQALQTVTKARPESINWDAASPADKNLAKGIYEGRIRPFDLGYKDRTVGTKLANEYAIRNGLKPFESYSGNVKEKMAESLSSGKLGANALSLNTALGHAKSAMNSYAFIRNTDQRFLNMPINKIREQTNNPNIIKLQATLNALSGELAAVFKGSAGTDQEIGKWMQTLSQDLTPNQAVGAIQQINELLRSRLDALKYQQKDVMGGSPSSRTLLSPHASELQSQMEGKGNDRWGIKKVQ